jgi:anion-transporting  ArsA/GET3 family ATPase
MTLVELCKAKRIIVCVGSGGVGKTTTAATVGLHAARMGRRVIVCTIDPARRLANALGLTGLGHAEQQVPQDRLGPDAVRGGALWAMMLDQKRAFDEVLERYTSDAELRARIMNNRIYQQVSSTLTGSLEYAAMAKLQALEQDPRWDLVVLDTPPTANALDFLDAPRRLTEAIDSQVLEWFIKPYMAAGRFSLKLIGKGGAFVLKRVARFTGSQFLEDVGQFLAEFNEVLGGFRQRAQEVFDLLQTDRVAFVLVCSPDPLAIDEAIFFYERLHESRMPTGGFIINRVHAVGGPVAASEQVVAALSAQPALKETGISAEEIARAARTLRSTYEQLETLAHADAAQIERLRKTCGGDYEYLTVPFFDRDVYDTAGLSRIERSLFG